MSIDNYDWLKEIYKNIDFDKLPHGIIISGSKGLGKRLLANEIATKILSKKLDSNELALINSNNHPDFFKLDKEKILLHHVAVNMHPIIICDTCISMYFDLKKTIMKLILCSDVDLAL